jgi:hypothetical protein
LASASSNIKNKLFDCESFITPPNKHRFPDQYTQRPESPLKLRKYQRIGHSLASSKEKISPTQVLVGEKAQVMDGQLYTKGTLQSRKVSSTCFSRSEGSAKNTRERTSNLSTTLSMQVKQPDILEYRKVRIIGVSAFSTLHEAINTRTQKIVAIKTSCLGIDAFKALQKEVDIYQKLTEGSPPIPGMLRLIDSYESQENTKTQLRPYRAYNIVMERCVSTLRLMMPLHLSLYHTLKEPPL